MRLVSLSLDANLLDTTSVVAKRHQRYAETLDTLTVFVPAKTNSQVSLAANATVYGLGGFKLVQIFKLYRRAAAVMRNNGYDVVTSQDIYFLGLLGYFLARRFACGLEVQIHGLEKLHGFRAHLARFVLKRASSVRAVSTRAVTQVETRLGFRLLNVTIVPVYVDTSTFVKSNETDLSLDRVTNGLVTTYANRFNILTVARLVPVKNIPLQLKALEKVRISHPNVCLHIVGDGPLKAVLQAEVQTRGLEAHVVFHGYQTGRALQVFFNLADCFVLTSDSEGWGMAVIEAAYAGLPIIMTDVGCAGTVIRNREEGLVIPPSDEAALVSALERFITEPAFTQTLAAAAVKKVHELPNFETVLAAYHASWQRAAEHPLR